MTKAIVFYEDLDSVVRALWTEHLKPALSASKCTPPLLDTVNRKFVRYYQNPENRKVRSHDDVAKDTIVWLQGLPSIKKGLPLEKIVFFTDLAPEAGKTTPDTGYGLRVIRSLAPATVFRAPGTPSRSVHPLDAFLSDQRFVVIFHTVYPDHVPPCVPLEWPMVKGLRILTVPAVSLPGDGRQRKMSSRVRTTVKELGKGGPRVLLADRTQDEEFLSQLVAELLK